MSLDLGAIKARSAAHDIPGDHPEAYRWPVLLRASADDVPALVAEVEELRSKLALLTGAYIFDTGKRPVWPDARTLKLEPVGGEAPR